MADTPYNISGASLDDGTINYYTLIGEPDGAETSTLQAKIQELYKEAQANRDHRNLNKRREYQTLLEWLPRARSVLLEPEKRARYDAYLASAEAGTSDTDFDAFLTDLLGQNEHMDEKTGLLGVQDRVGEPRAHVIKTPVDAAKKPGAPTAPRQPAKVSAGQNAGLMGAAGGFIIGLVVGGLLLHSWLIGLILGVVLAVVLFGVLNKQPRGGIRS